MCEAALAAMVTERVGERTGSYQSAATQYLEILNLGKTRCLIRERVKRLRAPPR